MNRFCQTNVCENGNNRTVVSFYAAHLVKPNLSIDQIV